MVYSTFCLARRIFPADGALQLTSRPMSLGFTLRYVSLYFLFMGLFHTPGPDNRFPHSDISC